MPRPTSPGLRVLKPSKLLKIKPHCDCCNRDTAKTYVRSSALGPMSMAYCLRCLTERAEPEWGFHYMYDMVGTRGEGLADWVKTLKTFKIVETKGEYITWDEWFAWRRDPVRCAELDAKHDAEMEKLEQQEQASHE